MNSQQTFTKIFLKHLNVAITPASLKIYSRTWWKNNRSKDHGGLRLTDEGYALLKDDIDLKIYEIPLPRETKINTQTIIFLDQFIDCPYYLTDKSIFVTNEKKAIELHLFSGDLQKYGLTKAMSRYDW